MLLDLDVGVLGEIMTMDCIREKKGVLQARTEQSKRSKTKVSLVSLWEQSQFASDD